MLPLALLHAALAGTIEIQTTLAVDIHLDGLLSAKALGPSTILLDDVLPGPHQVTLYRTGSPHHLTLLVPPDRPARIHVSATEILVAEDDTPEAPALAPEDVIPPVVELRSGDGASFLVRIGDAPAVALTPDAPLRLDALPPGRHTVEITRPDQLVIWARGTLELRSGDQVTLRVAEGRRVEVFGRTDAWIPGR